MMFPFTSHATQIIVNDLKLTVNNICLMGPVCGTGNSTKGIDH